jgi:guanylate kinase
VNRGSDCPKPDRKPLLLVLSGPSGVGKDAVLDAIRKARPDIYYTINATSRTPRPGEVHGVHHYFVSEVRFLEMLARDELLEHAQVYGRWYGVPRMQVKEALARGQDVIARVDVQGAASIRRQEPRAVLVFLQAPSTEELERRLRQRKTDSEDQLALRLETARREMEQAPEFDHVVVNHTDAIAQTALRVMEILESERAR